MSAIRLAFSLIRIPRLFATLFLLPIIFSLALVYGQLLITGVFLQAIPGSETAPANGAQEENQFNVVRWFVYGDGKKLKPLRVCRWIPVSLKESPAGEKPPSEECLPDRLDVALQVHDPASFNSEPYRRAFEGNVERLHVCRSCHPDVIIRAGGPETTVDTYSVQGALVLNLITLNEDLSKQRVETQKQINHIRGLLGKIYFHAKDLRAPIPIFQMGTALAVVFNIGALLVISLWLALKAHRKVLDYFARNGALLPMVAATSKTSFYGAIWLLTILRVGSFLLGAIPLVYHGFTELAGKDKFLSIFGDDYSEFVLSILAITASLCLATIIASIADLKQRHHFLSVLYKYVPLALCTLGALIWAGSFLLEGAWIGHMRSIVSSLPILGMAPVLAAPIFKPQLGVLVAHTLLTTVILVAIIKLNARWFAAHLEEL